MLPKDTPYLYDDTTDEDYFAEFRELSNSIEQHEKKDKERINKENNHHNTDEINYEGGFNEFTMFSND